MLCLASELLQPPNYKDDKDWRTSIIDQLLEPTFGNISQLKNFVLIHGVLNHRSTNGILVRCVSKHEAQEILKKAHEQWCGEEGFLFHRLLQRASYF